MGWVRALETEPLVGSASAVGLLRYGGKSKRKGIKESGVQ